MSHPWQVLADCPHCRIEAAVVEFMEPRHPPCALGVPLWRRCRACGFEVHSREDGALDTVRDPADLRLPEHARAALQQWALDEGEPDLEQFCVANLGGSFAEVSRRLTAGEEVPTTFDVVAFLFPSVGAGAMVPGERPRLVDGLPPAPTRPQLTPPTPTPTPSEAGRVVAGADPRTPGRFLVSVMLADGALRAGERRFVDTFLARHSLPKLTADDLRVWRPLELGVPPAPAVRDLLLESAIHLMHLDRNRDGSEWRVVKVFASAWGVAPAQLESWDQSYGRRYSSVMQRLGALASRWLA